MTKEDKADRATQQHLEPHMGPKNGPLSHLAAVVCLFTLAGNVSLSIMSLDYSQHYCVDLKPENFDLF